MRWGLEPSGGGAPTWGPAPPGVGASAPAVSARVFYLDVIAHPLGPPGEKFCIFQKRCLLHQPTTTHPHLHVGKLCGWGWQTRWLTVRNTPLL